jgi:hypothetical protein
VVRFFPFVQADANRKSPDAFHKNAHSIFRWKLAGERAGGSRHAFRITVKLAFIGVDADIDLLACVHCRGIFVRIVVSQEPHPHIVAPWDAEKKEA